jgi:hypothetical protein
VESCSTTPGCPAGVDVDLLGELPMPIATRKPTPVNSRYDGAGDAAGPDGVVQAAR